MCEASELHDDKWKKKKKKNSPRFNFSHLVEQQQRHQGGRLAPAALIRFQR